MQHHPPHCAILAIISTMAQNAPSTGSSSSMHSISASGQKRISHGGPLITKVKFSMATGQKQLHSNALWKKVFHYGTLSISVLFHAKLLPTSFVGLPPPLSFLFSNNVCIICTKQDACC